MATEAYPDFVEAIRQKKALIIRGHLSQDRISVSPLPPEYRDHDWAIPSFDFAYALDPKDRSFIGRDAVAALWSDAHQLLRGGGLHLPFPECAFLFRYRANSQSRSEIVNLIHLWEGGNGEIIGNTFFQQDVSGHMRNWTKTPFQFALLPDGLVEINLDDDADLSSRMGEEYRLDARAKYQEVVNALSILKTNRGIVQNDITSPRLEQVNRGRSLGKLQPLPATRQIHFDRQRFMADLSQAIEPGSPKRAHERRGHYRKMRSGKEIWVRSSKIHGGSSAPDYAVSA